jgi:sialate O-acetylesterase
MVVEGPTILGLTNVLIGDVWLCSGQSNMEMGISEARRGPEEIAAANHERLRLFSVPKRVAAEPQETLESTWKPCNPATIVQGDYGGFTAAGYFFGRDLHYELGVPIGLIDSTWGGTVAEAWTSADALTALEDFRPAVAAMAEQAARVKSGGYDWGAALEQWFAAVDPGSVNAEWSRADLDAAGWTATEIPGPWEQSEIGAFDGIVWYRREFELPPGWSSTEAMLRLGAIDDQDTTWVNGVRVGSTDSWIQPREYLLSPGLLRVGVNTLAVRVLDTGGGGGFLGEKHQLRLESLGRRDLQPVSLASIWRFRKSVALGEAAPVPQRIDDNPNRVTVLFNGMIAPLVPFPIKGAIWYQGESNADRAKQYQRLLPALIEDWRRHFGVGPFPFLIVQLANFLAVDAEPVDSAWAELREAQWLTTQRVESTGIAVAIDIGEADDIHPRNKQEVGRRLALAARAIAYGQDLPYSGPTYRSMRKERGRIRLTFEHVGAGLVAQGEPVLRGFAVAGPDGKFVWADAVIEGETIVVSSPSVADPVAVRYAWANNPVANLYNRAGLPAVPFRTDGGE